MTGSLDIVRSPLVQAAACAQRLTRWWAAYLTVFGIVVGAALLVTPLLLAVPATGFPYPGTAAIVLLNGAILLLLAAWLRWYEERPFRTVGLPRGGARQAARGFLLGAALFGLATLVLVIVGAVHVTPAESGTVRVAAVLPALLLIPVWLFAAWAQEALTRGFLLQATGLQLAAWTAIGGQAVLWAVIRAAGAGSTDAMSLLNLAVGGVTLALVALTRGTLWLALGLQAGWSWFESGVLGIATSGAAEPAALVSLVPTSGSWLSGGAGGVMASPVVTIVLVAGGYWAYRGLRGTSG